MIQSSKIDHIKNKKSTQKLVCLTAYSYPVAKILDQYCDIILVGDSLGMTIYGHKDTTKVSLDMMINHGQAVVCAAQKPLIVVDLPFGTYEESVEQALESAQKVIEKTGCDAIKIETDENRVQTVKFLVENGVNVMGHVGLLPQSVNEDEGYKYQGRDQEEAQRILEVSKQIEEAGAFSLVIEAVPASLADKITESVTIPTIGIGASKNCDGQILVIDDVIGLNQEFSPKFVKKYGNQAQEIEIAVQQYCAEAKSGVFPGDEHLK